MLRGAEVAPAGSMVERHHVRVSGPPEAPVLLFAHGFGCDASVWAPVVHALEGTYRCVVFDTIGAGSSDTADHDPRRYPDLDGYAADLLGICAELDLRDVVVVAHSVSAMIAVVAAVEEPERFRRLVLVAATPYYLDDPATGYHGGFTAEDLAEVGQALDSNYFTWAEAMAPVIMGVPERPELGEELTASFCRTDPDIGRALLTASFATDCRPLLPRVRTPALLLQCRDDAMVPAEVAQHLHEHLAGSVLVQLEARGHCPHISAPEETARVLLAHLAGAP